MILLTGTTGAAGAAIVHEFAQARQPVRVLVRNRSKAAELENVASIEVVEGDMSRASTLGRALAGVDRALMISSPTVDMVDTQNAFIDASKAAGVRHLIKFSGLDARYDTTFPFGRMHKQIEDHLERSGLAWTHLRPTGFMQVYLREAPSIIHDAALYLALAETRLNPVDLVDIGKIGFALLRDGGHEGERLAVTGPEALTMTEVAQRLSQATGRTVRYVAVSREQRRQALISYGIPPEFADALDRQVEERLKGGVESRVDLSTHRLFNINPTTFLAFAQRNAQAFGAPAERRDGARAYAGIRRSEA